MHLIVTIDLSGEAFQHGDIGAETARILHDSAVGSPPCTPTTAPCPTRIPSSYAFSTTPVRWSATGPHRRTRI